MFFNEYNIKNISNINLDHLKIKKNLKELINFSAKKMFLHPKIEFFIIFVNVHTISQLNFKWLNYKGPTDVLSFPIDKIKPGINSNQLSQFGILGDVVICPQVAIQQAKKYKSSILNSILLLAIHGFLHLLGFHHYNRKNKKKMFKMQSNLLKIY